jgi:hypothetical protein
MRWIEEKGPVFSGATKRTPLGPMRGARNARWHYVHSMVSHPSNGSETPNLRSSVLCAGTKQGRFAGDSANKRHFDNTVRDLNIFRNRYCAAFSVRRLHRELPRREIGA